MHQKTFSYRLVFILGLYQFVTDNIKFVREQTHINAIVLRIFTGDEVRLCHE